MWGSSNIIYLFITLLVLTYIKYIHHLQVIGVYSSQKNKSKHGMVNIYCSTNFTASNNYIHKVIAVTNVLSELMHQSLVPAVLVIPLALSDLLVQNGRFQKISIPYHGRLPYFHPPLPSELPRCVIPHALGIL